MQVEFGRIGDDNVMNLRMNGRIQPIDMFPLRIRFSKIKGNGALTAAKLKREGAATGQFIAVQGVDEVQ